MSIWVFIHNHFSNKVEICIGDIEHEDLYGHYFYRKQHKSLLTNKFLGGWGVKPLSNRCVKEGSKIAHFCIITKWMPPKNVGDKPVGLQRPKTSS